MTKRAEGAHAPRERGFYPTPPKAFAPLAKFLQPGARVIEPCAGSGELCDLLFQTGCEIVAATDILPQHPDITQMDALDYDVTNTPQIDYFITNPPWPELRKNGHPTLAIIARLRVIAPTWLLLPADFMHNVYAAELMSYCGGVVSVGRVKWILGSKNEGFDNAAWYLFGRDKPNDGKIRFIPNAGAEER